jgi:hypothetical protein
MQRVSSADEFYERVGELLLAGRGSFAPPEEGGPERAGSFRRDFERAISGRSVVLCLDDFDRTVGNPYFDSAFFNLLHSMATVGEVAFLLSSRRGLGGVLIEDEVARRSTPFGDVFVELRLGPLTDEEAYELVRITAKELNLPVNDIEIYSFLKWAGRSPRKLKSLLFQLRENLLGRQEEPTPDAVKAELFSMRLFNELKEEEAGRWSGPFGLGRLAARLALALSVAGMLLLLVGVWAERAAGVYLALFLLTMSLALALLAFFWVLRHHKEGA